MNVVMRFREYMRLERMRTDSSLTPEELKRWSVLKRQLGRELSPGISDDRSDERHSIRIPTNVAVSVNTTGELRDCLMTNLSRGGLFLATKHVVELGTRLNLLLQVEGSEPIKIPVEVASHNLDATLGVFQPGMGMRFLEMAPDVQKQVDDLYERAGIKAVRAGTEATKE
jgi:uncharacterized protein (TIGR02266 family)